MTKEEYADKIADEYWDGADKFDTMGRVKYQRLDDGSDITYHFTTKRGLIEQMESLPKQESKTFGTIFFAKDTIEGVRIDKYAVAYENID